MKRILLGAGALALTASCGSVNQNAASSKLDGGHHGSKYDSIDWYFTCPFDGPNDADRLVVPPQRSPRRLVLDGIGPFKYDRKDLVGVPVTVHGRVCPWKNVHRDVVFAIDVSGSMSESDPMITNSNGGLTCGRMKALDALVAKMPAGITNFGVITYDDSIEHASTKLFSDRTALYLDLIAGNGRTDITKIICEQNGGTEYKIGLDKAKELLLSGEEHATKEIIFLSDGQPSDSEQDIIKTTDDLKTNGLVINGRHQAVSIATLLLGDSPADDILEKMASLDTSATPAKPVFAKAQDADQLADALGRLMDNVKLQGATVSHAGDAPNTTPTKFDVMPRLDARNQFSTQAFELNIDATQKNYTIGFEYWDTMQNRATFPGSIHWN